MSVIKLFLDEDVWLGLAAALRKDGFDVIHVHEVKRSGISDPDQLAYAAKEGRAILTHNTQDFVPLATQYFFNQKPHAGIIVSVKLQKGELIRRTQNLLLLLSAEEIANTLRYLEHYK